MKNTLHSESRKSFAALLTALALLLSACGAGANSGAASGANSGANSDAASETGSAPAQKTPVTFVLDWTPNTNHTGLYAALSLGYFDEAGLDVTVVQPPDDGAEVLVASGRAQFGVSFQDTMADALTGENPLPITAVAAVVQHNTSGIISRKGEGIDRPRGLMGKRYATWEWPVEQATVRRVVETDGGDFSKVELIPSTVTDEVSALQSKSVDAIWIFYGWAGIACEQAGLETDYFAFADIDPVFDYYTPVIIGCDDFLRESPETARAFVAALARGYEYAAAHPAEAAEILCAAAPELANNRALIEASQAYLSAAYIADALSWGVIDPARWASFYTWLNENGLTDGTLNPSAGFTNDFLPG